MNRNGHTINNCVHCVVLLLLLELGLRDVVVGWNESGSSEARNSFTLPVNEINVYSEGYLARCMFLIVYVGKMATIVIIPGIFHKLFGHVWCQGLVLQESAPHLCIVKVGTC